MDWNDWYKAILALVIWREARGEGSAGMRAVAHVIRNRVAGAPGHSSTASAWDAVIERKWQFSSLTAPGDSQLVQWPAYPDRSFEDAMTIATRIFAGADPDPTGGATHYCNLSLCHPAWADTLAVTARIGGHTFFK